MSASNESRLIEITIQFSEHLPEDIIDNVIELAKSSEWGIGLEELCNMIYEYDVPVKESQFQTIKEFADSMKLDESFYDILRELVV